MIELCSPQNSPGYYCRVCYLNKNLKKKREQDKQKNYRLYVTYKYIILYILKLYIIYLRAPSQIQKVTS